MQHLRELIDLGFAPVLALVIVAVIVLWAALCGVIVAVWRHSINAAKQREAERKEQFSEINGRLSRSEQKHQECDEDREVLHKQVEALSIRVGKFEACPRPSCPMRERRIDNLKR